MEAPLLIPCTPADLKALQDLSRTTFSESFAAQNNPEDFNSYLREAFSTAKLKAELRNPQSRFYFLRVSDQIAGYSKVNTGAAQTELQDPKGMEIERIYVLKAFQGMGFGGWMLKALQALAEEEGLDYIWLGVWEENRDAIRFYLRHGFVTFGRHPYYIGSDRQMDWMMRLQLPGRQP